MTTVPNNPNYGADPAGATEASLLGTAEPTSSYYTSTSAGGSGEETSTAGRAKDAASSAASGVARSAKHEASHVMSDVANQSRRVFNDAKQKTNEQLEGQQKQWSQRLGDVSRDLRQMANSRPDSPARTLVSQLAERSSTLAVYLSDHRPQEVIDEVQAFARRRPGSFLVAMAAAGFVAGRLGKSVTTAREEGDGA